MPRTVRRIAREPLNIRAAWMMLYAMIILLAGRTVVVHLMPDERAARQASSQFWARETLSSPRGTVYDRGGIPLAISVPSVSFFIDPQQWKTADAERLVQFFGQDTANKFSVPMNGRFRWVARCVPMDMAELIKSAEIPGLHTISESRRMYPHDSLASHTLGFCDIDGVGLAGIERQWNDILSAPVQRRTFVRGGKGTLLDVLGHSARSSEDGMSAAAGSVRLTIDTKIQQIVEQKLKQGAVATRSKWAAAVCVDPNTGEVIALASYPWMDLNDRSRRTGEVMRNNTVARVYEPGSTFKPIMLGIAMDAAKCSRGEHFSCSGKIKFADGVIRDVSAHGGMDLGGLLVKSCNTGMATLGGRMSAHKTYGMLRMFGFGMKSGIETAGEEEGLLRMPEEWLGTARANIAIGQGLAVTPLQLVMAISAIANGGDLLKPYIVDEVIDGRGETVHKGRRRVRANVLHKDTCRFIREAMFRTVEEGTGKAAKVNGVELAGKTGTAQIASKGQYAAGQYVGSFIGFWPARDPKYVMLVAMGEPEGDRYYGGQIAAPVFKSIVEEMTMIDPME